MSNNSYNKLFKMFIKTTPFTGFPTSLEASDFVVFGVPFDHTTSYLPGSRFAPDEIRKASINIETYYISLDTAIEEIPIYDLGNLILSTVGDIQEMLDKVEFVVSELIKINKIPVILGGEHLITLAAIHGITKSLGKDFHIIHFDAHFDLHDVFDNNKLNHATVMRRILDKDNFEPSRIIQIGMHAPSRDEYLFLKENGMLCFSSFAFQDDFKETSKKLSDHLENIRNAYITFDMDVFEPAFAPGVANPEPGGLTYHQILKIIKLVTDKVNIIGFDLVELNPLIERFITPIYAAKIVYDLIVHVYSKFKK